MAYTAKSYPGQKPVLPASGVLSVAAARDSKLLWVGTENGLVAIRADGRNQTLDVETGLVSNIIFSGRLDAQNRLWIATRAGLNCLSPVNNLPQSSSWPVRRLRLFNTNWYLTGDKIGQLSDCKIFKLKMRENSTEETESLWFSSDRVLCYVEGQWFVFRQAAGLPNDDIWTAGMDHTGKIWIGTEKSGIYRSAAPLTVDQFKEWQSKSVKLSDLTNAREVLTPVFTTLTTRPFSVAVANSLAWIDSLMWAATDSGVIAIREDQRIAAQFSRQDVLANANAFGLKYSPATKTLWLGTTKGFVAIDPHTKQVLRRVT